MVDCGHGDLQRWGRLVGMILLEARLIFDGLGRVVWGMLIMGGGRIGPVNSTMGLEW